MTDYIVAIPSRLASTRLPNKPLCLVGGMPLIRRVCMQALKSSAARVIACVDDEKTAACVDGLEGAEICMTSKEARCGTDRIAEMIKVKGLPRDSVIVNIQGDEPLINPEHIDAVARLLIEKHSDMATLCFLIDNKADVFDPNCVKVVFDNQGYAMYFSRAPIPYERDNFAAGKEPSFPHYHHVGIYAYRAGTVLDYTAWEQQENELAESLEQLRVLQHGLKIAVGVIDEHPETGVDTPEDLERVNRVLAERGEV